ncbi:MAG: DUF2079 domain-containing protein [Acidimicrobiales bacterium]
MSTAVVVAEAAEGHQAPPVARHQLRRRVREALPHLPVVAFMTLYAVYFSRLTIEMYRGYGQPGFDMGLYDQGLWLLSRFHAPFVTIMGRDLFGDHASLILLLIVPLYWIYPSVVTLCVLQSVVLALGALPVYLLARHWLGGYEAPTLLAGAFLLNPALQGGNIEQFHPDCFLVPLIGFAVYAAVKWRPWMLLLCAVLCLLVKEDAALLILPLGIWVWYRRDSSVGIKLVVGSLLAALVSTQLVMRGFFGVPELHGDRIPFGGLHGFVTESLRKPGQVVNYFLGEGRPFYLWQMTVPSALVFVRAPEIAAIAILVLGANVLSNFGYQHLIQYHYSLAIVPVLVVGTVFALTRITTIRRRQLAVVAIVLLSMWSTYLWGSLPALSQNKVPHWTPSNPQVHNIDAVLSALPSKAVVSAQYSYITHIDHRLRVYQWPTPFRAAYWGLLNQEGQRLPFANQVQYLVLPVDLDSSTAPVFKQISSQFVVVREVGNVMLLRRTSSGP